MINLTQSETETTGLREEVFYTQQFLSKTFDLRSQILFWRFDACVFVSCKILLDSFTQQLAFTRCIFEDCNIDQPMDEQRALIAYDNIFQQPIANRKADFERRLAAALARRNASCNPAGLRPEHRDFSATLPAYRSGVKAAWRKPAATTHRRRCVTLGVR